MSEVKIFRISGFYTKNRVKYFFRKDVRAIKEGDALEKVLTLITSTGLLRRQIKIEKVVVIKPEETSEMLLREISTTK